MSTTEILNVNNGWLVERQDVAEMSVGTTNVPDITGIEAAANNLQGIINQTPLHKLEFATELTGNNIYVKREDQSEVGSFKGRGAANKVLSLTPEERQRGIYTVSAGNHAQGTAMIAWLLEIPATIYMPVTTPASKVEATKAWGANVMLVGDNYDQTDKYAESLTENADRVKIPAFDDEVVIDGQGTVALELLRQYEELGQDLDYVFIPGGGGGLTAGMAKYIKAKQPDVKVIVVEPEDSNAIQLGYQAGYPRPLDHQPGIFAEALAVEQAGEHTLPYIRDYVDASITVTQDELIAAMYGFMGETKTYIEAAAACSIAGAIKYAQHKGLEGKNVATLATGAGISLGKVGEILMRGEELTGHEALFNVHIPEQPGSLREFCQQVVDGHNITEMIYVRNDPEVADLQIAFSMKSDADKAAFVDSMQLHGVEYIDRSDDDDFRRFGRRLVQRTNDPIDQSDYIINLPDRPGALMELLDRLDGNWDISEFVYKTDRSTTAAVRVGFVANATQRQSLEESLSTTGFSFKPYAETVDTEAHP